MRVLAICGSLNAQYSEHCRERAHGFDVKPASFPALDRADALQQKARNRRQLLGIARSLAKCSELCAT